MKKGRGRAIPQEMFGKIHDETICTIGLIQDSNLTIGTFIRPGESSGCQNSQITYLTHFVSIERSYNSNGEQRMQGLK